MRFSVSSNGYQMFKKILFIVLIIITYFWVVRPAREYHTTKLVSPKVKQWVQSNSISKASEVILKSKSSKSFYLVFNVADNEKEIVYSPQAGFFLLLAAIGLVFITLKWQYYIFLLGLHFIFELIVVFALWVGAVHSTAAFIFVDFIISYLSPVVSLGIIPTLLFYRNTDTGFKDHL